MARNFIQNKADVTKYYVNRAKKEEEKNQFKMVDTRLVKVRARSGKTVNNQQNKTEISNEHSVQIQPSPLPSSSSSPVQSTKSQLSSTSSSNSQPTGTQDYRFLLGWSYYLATQAAWLSPVLQQQQQGQSPLGLPNDPEVAAKFLQAMQTLMNPLTTAQTSNNIEQIGNEIETGTKNALVNVKDEANES